MTEAERYEKTLYKAPNGNKKKRNPQESWMALIASAVANSKGSSLDSYLRRLASLDNVPRKEKQFRNFTANSLNLRGKQTEIVTMIWKHLSELRQQQSQENESQPAKGLSSSSNNNNNDANGTPGEGDKSRTTPATPQTAEDHQKSKYDNDKDDNDNKASTELTNKSVRKILKKVLKKAPKKSLKKKALRTAITDKLGIGGNKSLKKKLKMMLSQELLSDMKKIQVDGKWVRLV
eukprot:CAMPEP_0116839488 /NCGR_PEP_ID=MMETSP0418-20121206/9800_1 /TAXON_ID=1158023 /ORGANISM="Astrosyne radiata, Strain 13vi08-1A" /LENGTH=233 /DNA_ID=CAMNT_0004469615 /DNA_START=95 /DNA_END=796 /DNA_ORIENTATION=-